MVSVVVVVVVVVVVAAVLESRDLPARKSPRPVLVLIQIILIQIMLFNCPSCQKLDV